MEKEQILVEISNAVAKIVEHKNFSLNEQTTANDIDGWDSITHMMIISEVEKVFNIKFKLMDLMNMNNIGDLITAIKSELQ